MLEKTSKEQEVLRLLNATAAGEEKTENEEELKALLGCDDLNLAYYRTLVHAYFASKGTGGRIKIYDGTTSAAVEAATPIAYPTAIAPKELLEKLPWVSYRSLAQSRATRKPDVKSVSLWVKKMQAGTGSSMTRTSYLAALQKTDEANIHIGAKGTDLFVSLDSKPGKPLASIAELQLMQLLSEADQGTYQKVIVSDIVSSETENSVQEIWQKPVISDSGRTYSQVVDSHPGIERHQGVYQSHMPTLTKENTISFARTAPAGHALFAVDALRAAYLDGLRPESTGPLISVIGNGEDLSSAPSAEMVEWMAANKIPIVMVTTEKTNIDLKGGQIALLRTPGGPISATIIEQAQAKEAGQVELFEKLGLTVRNGDQIAFFNTNMALFNYDVLAPKVKKLVAEIGEAKFMEAIAPDLIVNAKEQKDQDGATRTYYQLEGAMGSTLLKFDRFWRERYGEPLVHFINVEKEYRTDFFSPIKTAFDFFMQFHSDRFVLDQKSMRLRNLRPGTLPIVNLKDSGSKDKFYQDVQTVLTSFEGTSVKDLDRLEVEGKIRLNRVRLKGQVKIVNRSSNLVDVVKLLRSSPKFAARGGELHLEDIALEIEESGQKFRSGPWPA